MWWVYILCPRPFWVQKKRGGWSRALPRPPRPGSCGISIPNRHHIDDLAKSHRTNIKMSTWRSPYAVIVRLAYAVTQNTSWIKLGKSHRTSLPAMACTCHQPVSQKPSQAGIAQKAILRASKMRRATKSPHVRDWPALYAAGRLVQRHQPDDHARYFYFIAASGNFDPYDLSHWRVVKLRRATKRSSVLHLSKKVFGRTSTQILPIQGSGDQMRHGKGHGWDILVI